MLDDSLNGLGDDLVKCDLSCEGTYTDPDQGIIPRCLILERRPYENGCIVVGYNPGKCKNDERKYYINYGIKFSSIGGYFNSNLKFKAYYQRTRDLIGQLGFNGDILWTDLAKCECTAENKKLPIQTLRVCINRFLRREIDLIHCSTIFALGNASYEFLALSFPDHYIVGLPHPTGSFGDFTRLKNKITANREHYLNLINNKMDKNGNYLAIHLSRV